MYTLGNKSLELDSRKAVFVGGVPRPLKAFELAEVMTEKYGTVAYVAIDCDADLKYPKGRSIFFMCIHCISSTHLFTLSLNVDCMCIYGL